MGWLILFVLAAGPTVLGYGLYNKSLTDLPSSTANLIVTMEPAITAAIAYVLLGERMNQIQIGGSFMILMGVILLRVFEGRQANQHQFQEHSNDESAISNVHSIQGAVLESLPNDRLE